MSVEVTGKFCRRRGRLGELELELVLGGPSGFEFNDEFEFDLTPTADPAFWKLTLTHPLGQAEQRMRGDVNDQGSRLVRRAGVLWLLLGVAVLLVRPAQTSNVGVFQWVQRFPEQNEGGVSGADMAVDGAGNILVTGRVLGEGGSSDFLTMSYAPDGTRRWLARYPGAHPYRGLPAVAVDLNGNVYVTGLGKGPVGEHSGWTTFSYTPEGVFRWQVQYSSSAFYDDAPVDLRTDRDGNIVLTGTIDNQLTTLSYSPDGVQRWIAHYALDGLVWSKATALAVDTAGDVFVTGSRRKFFGPEYGRTDMLTLCYSASGVQKWGASFRDAGAYDISATAIATDHQGNAYVTASAPDYYNYLQITTISYDPEGAERWVARHGGDKQGDDLVAALAVDSQDNVYVAGTTTSDSQSKIATVSYTSGGAERWVRLFNSPERLETWARALAIDAKDQLYIGGGTGSGNDYRSIVVSYDPTGVERWVGRYDGPEHSNEQALAVALAPNGDVCVTGLTEVSPFEFYQLLTLKYHPDAPDTTAPSSRIGSLVEGASDAPSYFPVRITDVDSGIAQVQLTAKSTNCRLEWDGPTGTVTTRIGRTLRFSPPVPSAQLRIARQKGPRECWINLRTVDALGNASIRKIGVVDLSGTRIPRLTRIVNVFPEEEHYVRFRNGSPGLSQATLRVNGTYYYRGRVADGQVLDLDVSYFFRPGDHNRVDFVTTIKPGATARLTLGALDPDLGSEGAPAVYEPGNSRKR